MNVSNSHTSSDKLNDEVVSEAGSMAKNVPKEGSLNEGLLDVRGDQISPVSSNNKNDDDFDDDIETVIDKKEKDLLDKEKDIDSELDFELKWDDETDYINTSLDDDQPKEDDGQMEVDELSEKELLREVEDESDKPDNVKNLISTLNRDKDEKGNPKSSTSDISNVNKNNVCTSVKESDVNTVETHSNNFSRIAASDSESTSLDEQLIYSDADVPDIADKELIDEIDAQISESAKSPKTLLNEEQNIEISTVITTQLSKEQDTIDVVSKMDNEKDLSYMSDTQSSSNNLETSVYEINKEHKLTKPDIMIEIPSFIDDCGDLSDTDMSENITLSTCNITFENDEIDNASIENESKNKDVINIENIELNKKTKLNESEHRIPEMDSNKSAHEETHVLVPDGTGSEPIKTTVNKENECEHDLQPQNADITIDSSIKISDLASFDEKYVKNSNEINICHDNVVKEAENRDSSITLESTEQDNKNVIEANNTCVDSIEVPESNDTNSIDQSSTVDSVVEGNNTTETKINTDTINQPISLDSTDQDSKEVTETEDGTEAVDQPSTIDSIIQQNLEVMKTEDSTEIKDFSDNKDQSIMLETGQDRNVIETEDSMNITMGQTITLNSAVQDNTDIVQVGPSTSKDAGIDSDEVTDAADSLGLLAESFRVMDDDDEPEQEEDDEDDDFDQDDESNQMTAEHSEDSNAQQSETDIPKETTDMDTDLPDQQRAQAPVSEDCVADVEVHQMEGVDTNESEMEIAVDVLTGQNASKEVDDGVKSVTVEKNTDAEMEVSITSEIDNVKESDKLGNVNAGTETKEMSKLEMLLKNNTEARTQEVIKQQSPSKTKKLEIVKPQHEINIVDLEESSSEDDLQEIKETSSTKQIKVPPSTESETQDGVTTVNIPDGIDIMSTSAGNTSEIVHKEGESLISGVPKPPPNKPARLNTSEVTIKTASSTESTLIIPEAKIPTKEDNSKTQLDMEIFSLDSDEDDKESKEKEAPVKECLKSQVETEAVPVQEKKYCSGDCYSGSRKRRSNACDSCSAAALKRAESLIEGVKNLTPLLDLDMGDYNEDLVEISDSESEDEAEGRPAEPVVGAAGALFLEENLASMINETWSKFKLESRLLAAQGELDLEVERLEKECNEVNSILNECQVSTDKLRKDLYDTFARERRDLPAIIIYDTPETTWSGLEETINAFEPKEIVHIQTRQSKRRSTSNVEPVPKRPAIPLGYTPLDSDSNTTQTETKTTAAVEVPAQNDDDNVDISVVKSSAEAAPAGLPPPGELTRPPLRAGMPVYAMRHAYGSWIKAKILDVQPKTAATPNTQFTMCRVKFEHKVKNPVKLMPARCLAYEEPTNVRMTIGTRMIALFEEKDSNKRGTFYAGIVAEIPNPVNKYRYLIFFDVGYAKYVPHAKTRLVCECSSLVWEEVHANSRKFINEYLLAYPERPMVRLHAGQKLKTEWQEKWWTSSVVEVDASLVLIKFDADSRTEWIYRGSTRLAPLYMELQAAERQRPRPLPRALNRDRRQKQNMPYVEYTRSDEIKNTQAMPVPPQIEDQKRQRAVAKKSTAMPQPSAAQALDGITSRVVFYTPKNAIKPHKMVPHTCGTRCKRTDVLALKDLRTYNPLTKPLLSGWERQIVKARGSKSVMYRAPCGRRIRNYPELHRYLRVVESDMGVDLFDFGPNTHCLAEFLLNKCLVSKKDLSHGKENVPVPCVNYYDDSLPEFCSYNTERTPTAGVPLNLDPEFLCGCDCTDDCADKSKCACWKLTLEGARTIGLDTDDVGYEYKRLPDPLPSGIYECNSRCKCKSTCLNRVAQHPLQLKLQVFKTLNRGWGIRALNDVPKGSFLCVYAGNLLTDATANLDGLNEGDEYLAELDYIEVVEQMKENYEADIPDADKKLDKKESGDQEDSEEEESSSSEEEKPDKDDQDDDFRPTDLRTLTPPNAFSKRLRKRDKKGVKEVKENEKIKEKEKEPNEEENCITISDDEELREPGRFAAQAGMGAEAFAPKHTSVRALYGKDEACYIMDAKVQGNIGRYLNHSCTPNVFVQNVFVDTHDPRFPWVAFFALSHIKAGAELTWNYNYDIGSVPGKMLYCFCGAPNCRGRLL